MRRKNRIPGLENQHTQVFQCQGLAWDVCVWGGQRYLLACGFCDGEITIPFAASRRTFCRDSPLTAILLSFSFYIYNRHINMYMFQGWVGYELPIGSWDRPSHVTCEYEFAQNSE